MTLTGIKFYIKINQKSTHNINLNASSHLKMTILPIIFYLTWTTEKKLQQRLN